MLWRTHAFGLGRGENILHDKRTVFGIVLGLAIIIFSFVCPLFISHGEYEIFYIKDGIELSGDYSLTEKGIKINSFVPPTASHPLGTDKEGRDILIRLMYGGQISLSVAFITILLEGLLGTVLGLLAGYFGRRTDELIMRFVDVVNCIPDLPVILILSSLTTNFSVNPRHKIYNLVALIAFFGAMKVTRVVRGQVLYIKEQEYILAATAVGIGTYRKIIRHILPNVMPQIIIMSMTGVGFVILTESALSFLGFGLPYPYASWGNMITAVSDFSVLAKHANIWFPAGALIFLTVLSFNLIGEGLKEALIG